MERVAYYNGEVGLPEELKVPFLERVSFYGDGVYDATAAMDGVVVFAEDHINRFFNSCKNMEIDPGISKEELHALLTELVGKCDAPFQFLYWQVTRGTAPRNHAFPEGPSNLWVMVTPLEKNLRPADVQLVTVEDTRFFHCNTKTLNLLPNVIAAQRAKEAGCHEAAFIRPNNVVTECAHSNLHIIKDGVFITHQADNLILPGIARKHLISACERLGVPVEQRDYTKEELFGADEVLTSASSTPAIRVDAIDGVPVGGKDTELFNRIREAAIEEFEEYVAVRRA